MIWPMENDAFYVETLQKCTHYNLLVRKVPDDVFLDELAEELSHITRTYIVTRSSLIYTLGGIVKKKETKLWRRLCARLQVISLIGRLLQLEWTTKPPVRLLFSWHASFLRFLFFGFELRFERASLEKPFCAKWNSNLTMLDNCVI